MTALAPAELVAVVMLTALTIYAWLGGADFGAGVWDLLARGPRAEAQRALIAHAIGPVWEANHVWLIIVVVLLFTGFPPAFVAIMTALHVPLSLMLFGIVLRGSAFTFRTYDNSAIGKRRWSRAFSIPSVVTPVLLGSVIGAVATGRLPRRLEGVEDLFAPWLGAFPIAVGLFTLAIFAYLAAVYLTLETEDAQLRDDFRLKALGAGVAVGILAFVVYLFAKRSAPLVFHGLETARWGFPVRVATGLCALAAFWGLWSRRFLLAKGAAIVQVGLILWGCALAQAPYLVPPDLTIAGASAPPQVHRVLLLVLGAGSLILLPSLFVLFRIFKGHTLTARPVGPEASPHGSAIGDD